MEYLGMSDLVGRWVYTPQGVRKLAKSNGFPKPAFTVNAGRVPVWELPQIEVYEAQHLELFDHRRKLRKQRGYAIAKRKGFPSTEHGETES